MATITIGRRELHRMYESVQPEKETVAESRRKGLKQLSDDRVKNWPNTLEATRMKKESFKADRMAVEEKERQEVDRKEAQLQKEMRIAAIKRANTILYEQTDKMKNLRSQQMYSDVLADRSEQAEEKRLMKTWETEREVVHHAQMLSQISESEAREKAEVHARSSKNREIAEMQQAQLHEYRELYIRRLKQEKEEGELLLKKAEEDLLEDQERAAERSLKARMQCEEMQLANAHLRSLRAELAKAEEIEEAKRKSDLQKKEALGGARLKLERDRFEARQATRQKMIDKACEELARIKNTEETRLEKQANEVRDKEDALEQLRSERARRQAEAIDRSRQMQLQLKAEKRRAEKEQTASMVEHWQAKNADIEREESEEGEARRVKYMEIRATQEAQLTETRARKAAEKQERLFADQQTLAVMLEDDERFKAVAADELAKARADGKHTHMIEKALNAKDVTLLACTGSRV